jgi:hypothetical protein
MRFSHDEAKRSGFAGNVGVVVTLLPRQVRCIESVEAIGWRGEKLGENRALLHVVAELRGPLRYMVLCCVAISLLTIGCGGEASNQAPSNVSDQQIFLLETGERLGEVEAQLGRPDSQVDQDESEALSYGSWRLWFVNNRLAKSVKDNVLGRGQRPRGRQFDGKVLSLEIGSAAAEARDLLGSPERFEQVVRDGRIREEVWFYGTWELRIVDNMLTFRSKW